MFLRGGQRRQSRVRRRRTQRYLIWFDDIVTDWELFVSVLKVPHPYNVILLDFQVLVDLSQMDTAIGPEHGPVITESALKRLDFGMRLFMLVHGVQRGEGLATILARGAPAIGPIVFMEESDVLTQPFFVRKLLSALITDNRRLIGAMGGGLVDR